MTRVADAHRNPALHRRLDRLGMEDASPEVGEFRRLRIGEVRDRARLWHEPGVSSQETGHVRPDLDLTRIQRGADQCGRVIRSPATQGRGGAAHRGRDESPKYRDQLISEQRTQMVTGTLAG